MHQTWLTLVLSAILLHYCYADQIDDWNSDLGHNDLLIWGRNAVFCLVTDRTGVSRGNQLPSRMQHSSWGLTHRQVWGWASVNLKWHLPERLASKTPVIILFILHAWQQSFWSLLYLLYLHVIWVKQNTRQVYFYPTTDNKVLLNMHCSCKISTIKCCIHIQVCVSQCGLAVRC